MIFRNFVKIALLCQNISLLHDINDLESRLIVDSIAELLGRGFYSTHRAGRMNLK